MKKQVRTIVDTQTPEFQLRALNVYCQVLSDSKATAETREVIAKLIEESHNWFRRHGITLQGNGFEGFRLS